MAIECLASPKTAAEASVVASLLIVDDEKLIRQVLRRHLELQGYKVATAASGREALDLMLQCPFDAVLLDVSMPEKSGLEVLKEIREKRSPLDLPVIMVTADSETEHVVKAFECGANDYITKPIHFPIALARITGQLAAKSASDSLRKSEMRYSLSARGANDGLWDWDLRTDKIYYSSRWKSLLGHSDEEIADSPREWLDRIHPDDLPQFQSALAAHRAGRTGQFECEHRILHRDHTYRWALVRGALVRDENGQELRMAGSQTDITRAKAADALTSLPNRVLFMDRLDAALNRSKGDPDHLFAVLFCDLDRFKVVNDSLGHLAGDQLLITAARRLEASLRRGDTMSRGEDSCTIARFGGDEFIILVDNLNEPEDACRVGKRIQDALSQPVAINGHAVFTSISIGIAMGSAEYDRPEDLLRDADTAMYRAKTAGKNRYMLFDRNMRMAAVARLEMESALRRALEQQEFRLYYQPIVSLSSGHIEGFEALLRWDDPLRGLLEPAQFIPIAEETGQIVAIGRWVLREACRKTLGWQKHFVQQPPLFVSVNLSCKQFAHQGLLEEITDALRETELAPSSLKLEITESAIMENPEGAAQILGSLRKLGVRIGVDDFGTGYSSLSYLRQFPIDTLKVDRSFINQLDSCHQASEIVQMIVSLARNLHMEVIAEGIEKQEQQSRLLDLDCEYGQGFLFSKPVNGEAVEALLSKRHEAADCRDT